MKVPQHPYLSPEAAQLRRRDGTRPWDVHICEIDSFRGWEADDSTFGRSLAEARRLRDELEAGEDA